MQRRVTIEEKERMGQWPRKQMENERVIEGRGEEMRHKLEIQGRENIFMHLEMYKYYRIRSLTLRITPKVLTRTTSSHPLTLIPRFVNAAIHLVMHVRVNL